MPKASIIIPAYNAASFIEQTLASIMSQSFQDYECIVIDDGSTDDTVNRVESIDDHRFRVISTKNSGGPAAPRNLGLSAAVGDYIFIFDSDDIMLPEKLDFSIKAMELHKNAGWLFTNFQKINEDGHLVEDDFLRDYKTLWSICESSKPNVYFLEKDKLFDGIIKINFIGTSSVVIRRSALQSSDRFDEELKNSDDRLFWARFSKSYDAIFLNYPLHQYRIREGALSHRGFDKRAPSKILGLKKILLLCMTSEQRKVVRKQIYDDYLSLCNYLRRENKSGAFGSLLSSLNYGFDKRFVKSLCALLKYKYWAVSDNKGNW